VRAAVERAKARKAQAEQPPVTETPAETNAADDKKAAVRAAVERAKARKAQQESK
jgi:electron transport complex protein RnfC